MRLDLKPYVDLKVENTRRYVAGAREFEFVEHKFGQFRSFDMSHGGFIAHLGDKVLQAEGCHKSAARLYSMSRPCSELK